MADNSSSEASLPEVQSTPPVEAPKVTFENLTFSDGTVVALDEADIVVFVGPNNAGKSAALRELEEYIGSSARKTIIIAVSLRHTGTGNQLVAYLEQQNRKRGDVKNCDYLGFRFALRAENVENWFATRLDVLRPLFCLRVATETRITDSNPAGAIPILDEPPSNPIHLLYADETIEHRISGYFQRAFDQELIVFRAGGSQWPLLVGSRPQLKPGEQIYGAKYNERLRASSIPLQQQGDGMRSFASVILHLLTPILRLSFYLMNRRPFFIRRKHVSSGSLLPKKDRSAHNYSLLLTVRTFCGACSTLPRTSFAFCVSNAKGQLTA